MSALVRILYTNYKGETRKRTIIPQRLWYGTTEWHKESQWLLDAIDVYKDDVRTFAVDDIVMWDGKNDFKRRFTAMILIRSDAYTHLIDAFMDVDEALGNGCYITALGSEHYDYAMMIYEATKEVTTEKEEAV